MQIAKDNINPYALRLEDAQGDIRELVKRAYLYRLSQGYVNRELDKIISEAVKNIEIPRLQNDARISLINFANAQRVTWQTTVGPELLEYLVIAMQSVSPPPPPSRIESELFGSMSFGTDERGVPLQRFYQDVWKQRVQPVIDKLVKERALDPNDLTGRNSLRNLAEMEVRYHDHQDSIDDLRASGARLVVCSSHADCSDRCAKWQGRVYSLDGTSGEIDGHKYVPLETATDVYYTTKSGRTYKNGLLGFNCRHYLTEYRGQLLPTVSAKERRAEYDITKRQRLLEREVRDAKANAQYYKDIDTKRYKEYARRARDIYAEYKRFSAENNRAYYPMRVRI